MSTANVLQEFVVRSIRSSCGLDVSIAFNIPVTMVKVRFEQICVQTTDHFWRFSP